MLLKDYDDENLGGSNMLNKMKKLGLGFLGMSLILGACTSNPSSDGSKIRVAMVTDTGGANDKSFNQGTNEGIQEYASANAAKWVASPPIVSKSEQDYETNLNQAATKNDVVVAAGYYFEKSLLAAAIRHKNIKFIGIDVDYTKEPSIPDNLMSIMFAEEQSGFLAGVTAALKTKTNKVGYLGGGKVPAVQKFGWGYIAGVHAVNPDIEIVYEYAGVFNDVALGSQKALAMYNNNVDILFVAAGETGVGAISETKNQVQAGKDVWVIGVDRDQYDEGKLPNSDKSVVLTSAVKQVGEAAQKGLESIDDDTFQGGTVFKLTLKDDAVGLPDENPNLTDDIVQKVKEYQAKLKSGEIVAPDTVEAVKGTNVTGKY